MEIYSVLMEEIWYHTGLTPSAFFTVAALMVVVYKTVSSMFVSPEDFNKPPIVTSTTTISSSKSSLLNNYFGPDTNPNNPKQSFKLGNMTHQQLRAYNGYDPNKPILIAIKGQIYDVSSARMFYGPGGPYAMFAGKEASRALALLSFKPEDINGNLEDLGPDELQILEDWEFKFIDKYAKVGQLVTDSDMSSLQDWEFKYSRGGLFPYESITNYDNTSIKIHFWERFWNKVTSFICFFEVIVKFSNCENGEGCYMFFLLGNYIDDCHIRSMASTSPIIVFWSYQGEGSYSAVPDIKKI